MTPPADSGRPAVYAALLMAAFAWGFAEAVFLFIVVDVLLTFIALHLGFRRAMAAALVAAAGAVVGGLLMRGLAVSNPAAALRVLGGVPFLRAQAIETGIGGMGTADWPLAMLRGSFTGIPYKVFAVGAGQQQVAAPLFALATLPIRLVRYTLAVGAVTLADRLLGASLGRTARFAILAAFWVLFYGEFWLRVSSTAAASPL